MTKTIQHPVDMLHASVYHAKHSKKLNKLMNWIIFHPGIYLGFANPKHNGVPITGAPRVDDCDLMCRECHGSCSDLCRVAESIEERRSPLLWKRGRRRRGFPRRTGTAWPGHSLEWPQTVGGGYKKQTDERTFCRQPWFTVRFHHRQTKSTSLGSFGDTLAKTSLDSWTNSEFLNRDKNLNVYLCHQKSDHLFDGFLNETINLGMVLPLRNKNTIISHKTTQYIVKSVSQCTVTSLQEVIRFFIFSLTL